MLWLHDQWDFFFLQQDHEQRPLWKVKVHWALWKSWGTAGAIKFSHLITPQRSPLEPQPESEWCFSRCCSEEFCSGWRGHCVKPGTPVPVSYWVHISVLLYRQSASTVLWDPTMDTSAHCRQQCFLARSTPNLHELLQPQLFRVKPCTKMTISKYFLLID